MSYAKSRGRSKTPATVDSTVAGHGKRGPKPDKPYPDFPLYAHAAGVWAKRIRGREHYFGPWSDPDAALRRYLDQRDYLHAGAPPPAADGVSLDELVNRFLEHVLARVERSEVSRHQFNCYRRDGKLLLETLGRTRPAASLTPADWRRYRTVVATRFDADDREDGEKLRSPSTVCGMVIRVRTMFRWAHQTARLLERAMDYGGEFSRPSAAAVRISLARRGPKAYAAAEVHRLIAAANVNLRAMVLLGVNAGLGNTDVASLRWSDLELTGRSSRTGGWHNLPRSKTGVARRCWLWPETVAALLEVRTARSKMDERREPPQAHADLVFLTLHRRPYVTLSPVRGERGGRTVDSVRLEFTRLARSARTRTSFYALRHTFRTVADETGDFPAVDVIMGHTPEAA
ncbi:MAG TPA: tyrosine-type recombinase/integrase, partial [Phycisphaerae bacterium]|nr:tyrosine-type recombinase/integrase [Phycisphaerae bacterium]